MAPPTHAIGEPAAERTHQRGQQRPDEVELVRFGRRKLDVDQHREARRETDVRAEGLKTASALGITIPQPLLLRVDDVIQ